MSQLFQKVMQQLQQQLPFVVYCKPNSEMTLALFQKNDELIALDSAQAGFAFVSFDNQQRYLIPENLSDIYFEKINTTDFILSKNKPFPTDQNSKLNFENLVKIGVETIKNSDLEKVVLSRLEKIQVDGLELELVFKQLLLHYQSAFKYCFFHPKVGFWIGASPEQFLKIEKNSVKTVALAGTQLNTGLESVKWGNKEIEEQQIVTDFIGSILKEYAQDIQFSAPYTHQAGSVVHIKTDIEAQLDSTEKLEELLSKLHPTPAVCGFPKAMAKDFILKNEGYNREFYAGFLGEWNKDFLTFAENVSDLFVNLRCMKIEKSEVNVYVGCGITAESDPEKEFVETLNKSQTMKKIL